MESLVDKLQRIRIVLVEPRYHGNLGQVARAMRNFGLSRLVLVGGRADPEADEARWYAREEGEPVLRGAERVATLDEAVAGCRLVIGTSRRLGKRRGPGLTPEEVFDETKPWRAPYETAILFGREAHGLSTAEVDRCQRLLWIPSDPAGPSLNLAHAVAVVGYVLARRARADLGTGPRPLAVEPAPVEQVEEMFRHARRVWSRIGYLHAQNPDAILRRWRQMLGRALLTEYDVRVIRALLHQTEWVARVAGIPEGGPPEAPAGLFDKHRKPDDDS
ncbi:MAG: RNA methyltransferase [Acidobacteria bacterium]|nr:MAG: RNA methyltransferase [Acidobacteriota bacterium]